MADIQNYQMLIDGAWVDASAGHTFNSINPATGKVWARFPKPRPRMWTMQCVLQTVRSTTALGQA